MGSGLALTMLGAVALLGCPASPAADGAPAVSAASVPERWSLRLVATHPHDREAFTQGLLWHDGRLYEGTGLFSRSRIRRLRLEDGGVEAEARLPDHLFGEGIALVGDRLWQLTWQDGLAFVWNVADLQPVARANLRGEGWGLCYDGSRLVRSDGSDVLTLHDPRTFAELGSIRVTIQGKPLYSLNELECVGGEIWANVWQTDRLVRIDGTTGRVTAVVDVPPLLTEVERANADVLNGIAYRADKGTFLITGKLWPKLFEVMLEPPVREPR